jgi:hypothetical protein
MTAPIVFGRSASTWTTTVAKVCKFDQPWPGNSIHKKTTFRPPGSSVRVLPLPALELPDIIIGAPMRIIAVDNFSPSRVVSGSGFSPAAKIEMRFSVKGTTSKFVR